MNENKPIGVIEKHYGHYGKNYAEKYIEKTMLSPYTISKNKTLATIIKSLGFHKVLDLGCNINSMIKKEGSLRWQMEQKEVEYFGLDLSPSYFDRSLVQNLHLPEDQIYTNRIGIVGDITNIPLENSSFNAITCADVLEHVPNPNKAFKEIHRILSNNGRAIIVLPSMYKLDLADFKHIDEKRKSSHESKLTFFNWKEKWEQAALKIDYTKSRPLGIASGLSYLAWLDCDFVPERKSLEEKEIYSKNSILHKKAKKILSKYDEVIDNIILELENGSSHQKSILEGMKKGTIKEVFQIIKEITAVPNISTEEQQLLNKFFDISLNIESDRITKLKESFNISKNPLFLLGNSMIVVLEKA